MSKTVPLLFACFCACLLAGSLFAQKIPLRDDSKVTIRIVDDEYNPIEGASVSTFGGTSGLSFPLKPSSGERTDSNGELVFDLFLSDIPDELRPSKSSEILLQIEASHEGFVSTYRRTEYTRASVEVRLERGFQVALSARDPAGEIVTEGLFALSSFAEVFDPEKANKWTLHESGLLVSPTLPMETTKLRLVQVRKGKPTLFSKDLTITPRGRDRIIMRNIKLKPGVGVGGSLDKNVPRPFEGGFVSVVATPIQQSSGAQGTWQWSDFADIKPDGSFTFESLPRHSQLSFYVIHDQWINRQSTRVATPQGAEAKPKDVETSSLLVKPARKRLLEVDLDFEIAMQRTAILKVVVKDESGNPLEGRTVYPLLVQEVGQISTGYGNAMSTRARLLKEHYQQVFRNSEETSITNADGVAILSGLPPFQVGVVVEGLEQPFQANLQSGKPAELVVTVSREASESDSRDK